MDCIRGIQLKCTESNDFISVGTVYSVPTLTYLKKKEMIRNLLSILLILVAFSCEAQSVSKRYSNFLTNKGTIYFFRPAKLDKLNGMDNFTFDMTYLTKKDSVTINCSIDIRDADPVNLIKIQNGIHEITGEGTYMIFRDVIKKG